MAILHDDFKQRVDDKFNYGTYIHLERYNFAHEEAYGKCLDIGCGYGYGTNTISSSTKIKNIIGIDIVEEVINEANKKYSNDKCSFILGDALALPFEDNQFDTVISFENIEHVNDYEVYLKEMKRVLKPSGIFLLSTPNNRDFSIRLQKILKKIDNWPEKYQPNKWHIKEFHYDELVKIFNLYNFKIIKSFGQVLRIPKIPSTRNEVLFRFLSKIAYFLPKYSLIMVFKLKNIK